MSRWVFPEPLTIQISRSLRPFILAFAVIAVVTEVVGYTLLVSPQTYLMLALLLSALSVIALLEQTARRCRHSCRKLRVVSFPFCCHAMGGLDEAGVSCGQERAKVNGGEISLRQDDMARGKASSSRRARGFAARGVH
jgi:hypothetical protein